MSSETRSFSGETTNLEPRRAQVRLVLGPRSGQSKLERGSLVLVLGLQFGELESVRFFQATKSLLVRGLGGEEVTRTTQLQLLDLRTILRPELLQLFRESLVFQGRNSTPLLLRVQRRQRAVPLTTKVRELAPELRGDGVANRLPLTSTPSHL